MTIEIIIHIKEVSILSTSHSLLGYCYLVSENNISEQLERKKEGKQVYTSIDDVEMKCYQLECALNDLIKDEYKRFTVDYSFNFTENQESALLKYLDADKRYYSGYTSKVNKAVKKMINEL